MHKYTVTHPAVEEMEKFFFLTVTGGSSKNGTSGACGSRFCGMWQPFLPQGSKSGARCNGLHTGATAGGLGSNPGRSIFFSTASAALNSGRIISVRYLGYNKC